MSSSVCRFSSQQTNPEASSCVSSSWRRGSAIQKRKETRERHDQLEISEWFQALGDTSRKRLDLAIASGLGDASIDNDQAWLKSKSELESEPFRSSLPLREPFSIRNISRTRFHQLQQSICDQTYSFWLFDHFVEPWRQLALFVRGDHLIGGILFADFTFERPNKAENFGRESSAKDSRRTRWVSFIGGGSGGAGGAWAPSTFENFQKIPFSPSRISQKNGLSPPKVEKNVMSPPPQNSFRRPWFHWWIEIERRRAQRMKKVDHQSVSRGAQRQRFCADLQSDKVEEKRQMRGDIWRID